MARFHGTPELDATDLAGTAFLLAADRAAKGLPPLADPLATARLAHFGRRVDGLRKGGRAAPKGGQYDPSAEGDPRAADPAHVAEASDLLRRVLGVLPPADGRLLLLRAAGFDSDALAERVGCRSGAVRMRLLAARRRLTAALQTGGPLADLGAEGWTVLAPRNPGTTVRAGGAK